MLSTEVIERVLATAVRAPSVHNTQPWQVTVRGDAIEVRADPARALRHTDPQGREATISCGALVDHAVVAARREGLDAQVVLLPDGAEGRLARIVLSQGPAPSASELELSVAAVHRRTSRTLLDDLAVDGAVAQSLQAVVADAQAHLVLLPASSAARGIVLREVERAERLASEDEVGTTEEAVWSGPAQGREDGVPVADGWENRPAREARPGSRRLTDRFRASPDAQEQGSADAQGRGSADAQEHGAVLALLTTPADTAQDWLVAGRALSRMLLTASVHGLAASFATTVLENPTTRHEVVRSLGLVGAPQMLVQLGYGEPGPRSSRRPVTGTQTRTG